MFRRWLTLSSLLLFTLFSLSAQQKQPVLTILPFTAVQDLQDECLQLEKLVQSYITELNLFRLTAIQDRDRILLEWEYAINNAFTDITETQKLGSLLSADYLLQGTLGILGNGYVLTLEVIKVKTGEKISFSSIEPTVDMLSANLKILLLKTLMQQPDTIKNKENEVQKVIESETEILGTWRGDKGIELVRLFSGGTGQAILTSGARMDLKYSIHNGNLIVYQISQNTERYYHPLPYKVALQLVALAKPMRWIFTELTNTSVLRGKKISTAVRYDQDQILEVIHDTERDAEWVRTGN
ncbi:TP0183 family DNA metabolism protein [Gracilinema caldarium]|uniref:Uncharacterized protein n=1 Tax=Gracilinema caldarium (strain ATCC 51460 / DSM 7334 / H1) TaxID=744872 RepID=F8F2P9_GRAC1|nr:hypothetical protein [Gracilinema caldarium]AEJ19443.1 hypothetical protein Spica_1297 [Gracilinema caldarium DSM 7334]